MQEGILSLMQLPKTVCAVEELHDARLPMLDGDGPPDDCRRARVDSPRWATSRSPSLER